MIAVMHDELGAASLERNLVSAMIECSALILPGHTVHGSSVDSGLGAYDLTKRNRSLVALTDPVGAASPVVCARIIGWVGNAATTKGYEFNQVVRHSVQLDEAVPCARIVLLAAAAVCEASEMGVRDDASANEVPPVHFPSGVSVN